MKPRNQVKRYGSSHIERQKYGVSAHYWREEMKPLLLAAACVDIAVKHTKEAAIIYQKIIDGLTLYLD